jgi:YHS domain-containing protein
MCAYGACDKDGYEMYKARENTAARGYAPRYVNYVFCSEKCKQAWRDELIRQRPR